MPPLPGRRYAMGMPMLARLSAPPLMVSVRVPREDAPIGGGVVVSVPVDSRASTTRPP